MGPGSTLNSGKLWIMGAHFFTWYMGFRAISKVQGLAWINLYHGAASTALVYHTVEKRYRMWRMSRPDTMQTIDHVCEWIVGTPWIFIGLCIVLAIIEELAWEILIYQEYFTRYDIEFPELSGLPKAIVTSVLMIPQLSHYFLDGYIWKMVPRNPGLQQALMSPSPAATARAQK